MERQKANQNRCARAKKYLIQEEIKDLDQIVTMYLDYAES